MTALPSSLFDHPRWEADILPRLWMTEGVANAGIFADTTSPSALQALLEVRLACPHCGTEFTPFKISEDASRRVCHSTGCYKTTCRRSMDIARERTRLRTAIRQAQLARHENEMALDFDALPELPVPPPLAAGSGRKFRVTMSLNDEEVVGLRALLQTATYGRTLASAARAAARAHMLRLGVIKVAAEEPEDERAEAR